MPTGPYTQQINLYGGSYAYNPDPYGYSRTAMPTQQNNSNSLMTVLVNSEDEVNNSPDYMRRNYNMGSSGHSIEDRIIAQIEMLYDEMQGDHEHKVLDKWIARIRNDVA